MAATASASSPRLPRGATDCHMHVYGGPGQVPAPFPVPVAGVEDYRALMEALGIERVVVVQSMLYGSDNAAMLAAVEALGPAARGVAVVGREPVREDLEWLDDAGVRGARAFMLDGGPYRWDDLPALGSRIAPFGWSLHLQLDGRSFAELEPSLADLPCALVIDHVGKFLRPVPPNDPSVSAFRRLIARGRCWVKLSGLYETSLSGPPAYEDVAAIARLLAADAPERMLWGSNWPHPNRRPPPDDGALLRVFEGLLQKPEHRQAALVDTPAALFGFPSVDRPEGLDAR